jgi:hypothetical protein
MTHYRFPGDPPSLFPPRTRERPWNLNHPEARAARLARTLRPLPSDATEAERKAYTVARARWRRARNLTI